MYASFSMILEAMERELRKKAVRSRIEGEFNIESVVLYRRGLAMAPGTLVIGGWQAMSGIDYAGMSGRVALIIASCEPELEPAPGVPCALFDSTPVKTLYQAALCAMQEISGFSRAVLKSVYRGNTLDEIVQRIHDRFTNPILIYDNSMRVLAYTRNDGLDERMWRDTVKHGALTDLRDDDVREVMRYLDEADARDGPFRYVANNLSESFCSCNIMVDEKRAGMVTVVELHHAISPAEQGYMQLLCLLLSFYFQKDALIKENGGLIYDRLILELTQGLIANRETLKMRLAASRWKLGEVNRALSMVFRRPLIGESDRQSVFHKLRLMDLPAKGMLEKDRIVVILSCKREEQQGSLERIRNFCEYNALRCGVSDAYDDILKTHMFVGQARLSLELSDETMAMYETVRYQNLMEYLSRYENKNELLHPAIEALSAIDAEQQTDYINTLRAYFACQHNQARAAQVMHIHRTTMFYRLQRITQLTGISLDDTRQMLLLQLSLEIHIRM
ncbi:MAG: helix-turn-helix domain-containing protein [Clostridia bacterium]|nr:helix-turn-helix domain-containing protein [Clostridia bacterium]